MDQPKDVLTFLLIPTYYEVLGKLLISSVCNVTSLRFCFKEETAISQNL